MKHLLRIFVALSLWFPISSQASEDMDPFMFGVEDVPYSEEAAIAAGEDDDYEATSSAQSTIDYNQSLPFIEERNFNFDDFAEQNNDTSSIPSSAPLTAPVAPKSPNIMPQAEAVAPTIKPIDTTQGLTDAFLAESASPASTSFPVPTVEGTWVDKLTSANPLNTIKEAVPGLSASGTESSNKKSGDSLENLVEKSRSVNKRSNASVFDISGLMLKMSLPQVERMMQNRGYRQIMKKYEVPNFIKWRNEEKCRNQGVVGYERIDSCVIDKAKKEKQQYVQEMKFSKFDTQEEINVRFTSNFTENKVYQITYKSMSSNITGSSPKALYLRNIKIYDFWKKINQKYGAPDNKEEVKWGLGGNKPYLKASTGFLKLEDPMFIELDYTRMSQEDQRYMNTDLYSF